MSNYVNNLNELINTKNEFKEIIIESGQTPGEVFSYYPNMIRNAIAAGGGSLVDYPTYTYVATYYPDFTYLFSYVGDALSGIDVDIDLSSYITSDELSQELSSYVTKDELSAQSYVTGTDLENASYVTNTYVSNNYVKKGADITTPAAAIGNLRVEGELKVNSNTYTYNIIPQENNTYTLGDSSHLYSTTYTNNIFMDGHSITYRNSTSILFSIANRDNFIMLSSAFCPSRVGMNLGMDYVSNKWNSTYTANIYADNAYISNYNNLIWTGTSAEYAALDNYTTYQIYLIKES